MRENINIQGHISENFLKKYIRKHVYMNKITQ